MDLFLNYYRVYISLMSIQNLKQNKCEYELQYHVCEQWIGNVCDDFSLCITLSDLWRY